MCHIRSQFRYKVVFKIPNSLGRSSHFVNDRVGWLRRTTAADLQHAINRKEANLPLYKQKYDNIELLLVADRTFNSGKLVDTNDLVVSNPEFRAIYFMSYPDSIQGVG